MEKITKRKILTAYGPHLKCPHITPADELPYGRTKQSFAAECDVNTIMARYAKTGVLDFANRNQPRYGNCVGLDYTEAQNTVARANGLFHELPARVRDRFKNSPAAFLDFVANPANRGEAALLGLLKPESDAPQPPATPPAASAPAPAAAAPAAASPGPGKA